MHDLEIPGFEIERLLGRGGMGAVYRAEQRSLGRKVAVKVLAVSLSSEGAVKRFEREARVLAKLNHPAIIQVFDIGQSPAGLQYIVMEYCERGSLGGLLEKRGRLSEPDAAALLVPVVCALGEAAEAGVHHRDLKPDNLLLDSHGRIKIADFGLARMADAASQLTLERQAMGTPAYMPPEQWRDVRDCDLRTDLYAIGVTLYELVTGQRPFPGPSTLNYLTQHTEVAPPDPRRVVDELSPACAQVVLRLLQKDPAQRYQDAPALARDLEELGGAGRPLRASDEVTVFAGRDAAPQIASAIQSDGYDETVDLPDGGRLADTERVPAAGGATARDEFASVIESGGPRLGGATTVDLGPGTARREVPTTRPSAMPLPESVQAPAPPRPPRASAWTVVVLLLVALVVGFGLLRRWRLQRASDRAREVVARVDDALAAGDPDAARPVAAVADAPRARPVGGR